MVSSLPGTFSITLNYQDSNGSGVTFPLPGQGNLPPASLYPVLTATEDQVPPWILYGFWTLLETVGSGFSMDFGRRCSGFCEHNYASMCNVLDMCSILIGTCRILRDRVTSLD